jgi:hypothetical protein
MIPIFRYFRPFVFISLLIFISCHKDRSNACNDPEREYPFEATASRWLFTPIHPGDSLRFKVYHKDKSNGGKYVYLRNEGFFIKDTSIQKIVEYNIFTDLNCNDLMISDELAADIIGPEKFVCRLSNRIITELIIQFNQKQFSQGADQFNSHQFDWDDSLTIEGGKYYNIKRCKGISQGSHDYIDSTYMYYNLKYGMLKFIINDTLVYQRNLH